MAFLPYPTDVLGAYGDQPAAVTLYAVTIALVSAIGAIMTRHALRAGLLSVGGRERQAARVADMPWWLVPGVFLLAVPAAFVIGGWAPLVWLLLVVVRRRRGRG